MRIFIHTSKWAIWSRRLGSFALPLTIIPVFLYRAQLIETLAFEVAEAAAIAVSVLAVVLAGAAFVHIWVSGDRGWGRAVSGGLLGLLCLVPVGYLVFLGLQFPLSGQVTTDTADPPVLIAAAPPTTTETEALLSTTYPNARPRTYPLSPAEVFALAENLVAERGWDIQLNRPPQLADEEGQLNAIATTLFGWRDEVSVRVRNDAAGSRVDVTSAALSALHEPGSNGSRIESLLSALDQAVTVTLRDAAVTAPPVPEAPPAPARN